MHAFIKRPASWLAGLIQRRFFRWGAGLGLCVYLSLWAWVIYTAEGYLSQPPAHQADVILVLGSRAYLDGKPNPCLAGRVRTGVMLAQQGLAQTLLMSGGRDHEDGRIEAEIMGEIARQQGFQGDLLLEPASLSTRQNMAFSAPLLHARRAHRVIVVSEPFHLWRAQRLIESNPVWQGLEVQYQPAHSYCWDTWGGLYKGTLREPLAIIYNGVRGYLGNG